MIVGIDPGQKGGVAAVTLLETGVPSFIHCMPMPEIEKLTDDLEAWRPDHVFLEKAQAMPKNGAVSMFNYGVGFGQILGVLIALEIPHTLVPPRTWTKVMHIGTKNDEPKKRSLEACKRIFPGVDLRGTERCKKPHDGLVDALLIAAYGSRALGPGPKLQPRLSKVPS